MVTVSGELASVPGLLHMALAWPGRKGDEYGDGDVGSVSEAMRLD